MATVQVRYIGHGAIDAAAWVMRDHCHTRFEAGATALAEQRGQGKGTRS